LNKRLGNRIIGALAVPHAALVAAAEMDAGGNAFGQIGYHGRLGLE